MTRTATNFTHGSSLIDDYLLIATPPVASDLGGRFVAVENSAGGQMVTELLAVGPDNASVIHFVRDKTSHSGWNNATVPLPVVLPAPIDKLVGFYEAGVLNVLVFCKGSGTGNAVTWMQQSAAGYWSEFTLGGAMAEVLASTTQVDAYRGPEGNHVVYGVAAGGTQPRFFLISLDPTSGFWGVNLQMAATSATPSFLVVVGEGSNELTILRVQGSSIAFRGGSTTDGVFQWEAGSQWRSVDLHAGDLTLNQLYGLPAAKGQSAFLLRANNTQLYYVSDFSGASPNSLDLTAVGVAPTGVSAICAGVDKNNLYMVFALDTANQDLWLLRQTGADASGNALFAPNWVHLGNALSVIACPTAMASGPEVFAVNPSADVLHLFEKLAVEPGAPAYGSWFTETVDGPTPAGRDPVSVSTYTTEIVLVDDNGSPVPSVVVNIKADRHTVIIANELSHHIGPDTPAQLTTTKLGKLTIAIKATTLTSPLLCINVPEFMTPGTWRSCPTDAGVFDKLADKTFTTGQSLINAGLLPPHYPDPDTLAKSIQTTGQLLVHKRSSQTQNVTATCGATSTVPFDLGKLAMPHYEIDFTTPGGPTVHPLTADEAKARILGATAGEPTFSFSDFWGDVAHFFKHAFEEITSFVHHVEQDVVNIAIYIGKAVKTFILKTIDDIGDMLEVLFHWLSKAVDAIEKAIKWLADLFDWDNIKITHDVVRHYVTSVLANAQTSIPLVEKYVNEEFATVKDEINAFFAKLESVFESGQSFNAFASKQKGGSQSALQGSQYHQSYHSNSARCNYAFSKAQNHFSNSTSLSGLLAAAPDSAPFDDFINLINEKKSGFDTSRKSTQTQMMAQKEHPNNFFDSVIVDFLKAANDIIDFILTFIDKAAISLLQGLDSAIASLLDTLTKPIHIPIISWLYEKIAGEPLSILDLLCLIIAIPMTILHDIVYGKPPFSANAGDPNYYQKFMGTIPWPSAGSTGNSAEAIGMNGAADLSPVQTVLLPLAGLSYFFYMVSDVCTDAVAAASEGEEDPMATFLSWSNIVTSTMALGFTVPYQVMGKPVDRWSDADKATVTAWAGSFLPIIMNVVFCVSSSNKAESRFTKAIGPIALSACGALVLGVSIWATVAQAEDPDYQNGWTEAANIMAPIPTTCAFLLPLEDATEGVSVAVLLAIAAICDIGTMVCAIAGAAEDE